MAKRRSLSERILGSDGYTALPFSAQALYVQLLVAADDEGMVGAPRRVTRSIGATEEDLTALVGAGLVLPFPSGVCALTHFHVSNYIPESRRRATAYAEEHAQLVKDADGAYRLSTASIRSEEEVAEGEEDVSGAAGAQTEEKEKTEDGDEEDISGAATAVAEEKEKTEEGDEVKEARSFMAVACKGQTDGVQGACDGQADGVRREGVKPPHLLAASPSPPSSFSPLTPISITPFIPLHPSSSPISSSSGGVRDALKRLASRFWGRRLRRYEREELCRIVSAHARVGEEDALPMGEMEELLEIAFSASAEANACNVGYVRGIYQNFARKGIHTPDDYATEEFKRDFPNGIL